MSRVVALRSGACVWRVREDVLARVTAAARAVYPDVDRVAVLIPLLPQVDWTADVTDEAVGLAVLHACFPEQVTS